MQINDDWLATILCALNDAIKYNDSLRKSETVNDIEDIEEWLLQIFECKEYLKEELSKSPELLKQVEKHLEV
ncbi:hypothetical protein SG34_024600 [Thalassomonas viridans]|uniref:Uncharacterized protein n=1 Tax=Thalassomonas viridans TaxID=137584 RepID=A0AAE9Z1T6_9GAMM|nr:hypothetical protein [Thalassomonas viridans]WDE04479.1 hypothetical protein SG34_024600 [Thalassomonas viridans]